MPIQNLEAFNRALMDFVEKQVPEALSVFVRALALRILRGVVLRTPVDTGRARGNWQLSIEATDDSVIEGWPKSTKKETSDPPTIGDGSGVSTDTISKGVEVLATVGFYHTVIVFNNVPYIWRLENGYSKQAASGMVAITLEEIRLSFGAAA